MSDTEKKKCTACAMLIPKDAQMCPYCKTIQPLPEKSSFGCSTIISGIVIVFIILAIASKTCSSSNSKTTSQQPAQTEVKTSQQVTPVLPNNTKNSYTRSASKPSITTQNRQNMPSSKEYNTTTQTNPKTQTEDIGSIKKTDNQNTTSFKETQQAQQEINQQENSKKEERQRKKQERKLKKQEKKNRQTE